MFYDYFQPAAHTTNFNIVGYAIFKSLKSELKYSMMDS